MGLIKCPECGKEISDMAGTCPNCGRPMQASNKQQGGMDSSPDMDSRGEFRRRDQRRKAMDV